jgi:hypothetical protein
MLFWTSPRANVDPRRRIEVDGGCRAYLRGYSGGVLRGEGVVAVSLCII